MGRRAQLFAGEERVPAAAVLYARALDEGAARAGGVAARAPAGAAAGAAGGPSGGAAAASPGAAARPPATGGAGAGAEEEAATAAAAVAAGGHDGEKAARAARKAERAARRAARVARRTERKGGEGTEADASSRPGAEGPGAAEAPAEPSGSPAGVRAAVAGEAGERNMGEGGAVKRKRERSAEEVEARLQKKERKRQERARAAEERERRAKEGGKQQEAVGGSAAAAAPPAPEPEPAAPAVDVESEAFTGKAVAGTTRSVIREAPKTFSFNFSGGDAAGAGVVGKGAGAAPAAPAPSGGPAGEGSDPRRLYLGGLPYWCGEKEIKDLLKKFGTVVSVEPLVFPDSGKFRGIAFVSMGSGRAAKRALELDGSDYEGRFLQVRPCTAKPQAPARAAGEVSKTPGYNVVYVGNLPWDCDEALLEGFFDGCEVTKVRLHTDRETGAFRGFAHVHFADEGGLDRAVALSGQLLEGREVKVAYAVR